MLRGRAEVQRRILGAWRGHLELVSPSVYRREAEALKGKEPEDHMAESYPCCCFWNMRCGTETKQTSFFPIKTEERRQARVRCRQRESDTRKDFCRNSTPLSQPSPAPPLGSPVWGSQRPRLGGGSFKVTRPRRGHLCLRAQSLQLPFATPQTVAPPGSSVHGILQARLLEWVAMPSSRGSSRPRDRTCVSCGSCIAGGFFIAEPLTWL